MTEIELLSGPDPVSPVPYLVEAIGLKRQIAVIQHTHRADSVDMYFDEPLWRRLLEFALQFGAGYDVNIIDRDNTTDRNWDKGTAHEAAEADEICAVAFLSAWNASTDPYKDPPEYIVVRDAEEIALCIATEYWTQIGGPEPYADSYTYSIFSREYIIQAVKDFLQSADAAHGWVLSTVPPITQPRA